MMANSAMSAVSMRNHTPTATQPSSASAAMDDAALLHTAHMDVSGGGAAAHSTLNQLMQSAPNNNSNNNHMNSMALMSVSSVHAVVEDDDDDLDNEDPAAAAPEWMNDEAAAVDALNQDTFGDDDEMTMMSFGEGGAAAGGGMLGMNASSALPGAGGASMMSSKKPPVMNLTLADMANYTHRLASEWEQRRGAGGGHADAQTLAAHTQHTLTTHPRASSSQQADGPETNDMRQHMTTPSPSVRVNASGWAAAEAADGRVEEGATASVGGGRNIALDAAIMETGTSPSSTTTTVHAGGNAAAALATAGKRVNEWDRRRVEGLKASGKGVMESGVGGLSMLASATPTASVAAAEGGSVLHPSSANANVNAMGGGVTATGVNVNNTHLHAMVGNSNGNSVLSGTEGLGVTGAGGEVRRDGVSPTTTATAAAAAAMMSTETSVPATGAAAAAAAAQPVRGAAAAGVHPPPTAPAAVSGNKTGIRSPGQKFDMITMHALLDMSLANLPHTLDIEPQRPYEPPNAIEPIPYFPQEVHPALANRELYRNFDLDTLFFIFYYHQKSHQQYFASKELKAHSFRYHTEQKRWYLRREKPRETSAVDERGSYMYFDFENTWDKQVIDDFVFEYKYLEDDLN